MELLLSAAIILQPQSAFSQQTTQPVLREILVTAQKRPENSQAVGITMAVIDANQIKSLNLQSLPEISNAIANVELFEDFSGAGIPTWVIRGVGLQDFNSNNTPTAAVYVDEVYQTATVMGNVGLFDVEQVEVLKGPQGGLYGRNTSGGAVLLNTRRPTLNGNSGFFNVSYGRWQNLSLEGASNHALSRNTALRVSGRYRSSNDAWQSSLVNHQHHGEKDLWNIRAWFSFQPNEDLTIEWKIQGGENNSEIGLGRAVGLYNSFGGFCDAVLQGFRDDKNCLSWAGLNSLVQGQANINPVDEQSNDGSLILSEPFNRQRNEYLSNTLFIKKSFARADFISITSIDNFKYGVDLDLDGSIGEFAHRLSTSDITVISIEQRLVSKQDSSLRWLAGWSLSEEEFEERRDFLFRDNFLVANAIGLSFGSINYDQNTSSLSLYGSLGFDINSSLAINASLRYTDEDKEYRNGDLFVPINPPLYLFRNISRDYKLDSHLSGSLGLNWQLNDTLLFYGSISKGFKAGGFYGGFPSSPEEINPYKEETILAYEVGIKSDWPNRGLRLNGALFYYDYRDVQGFVTRTSAITGTPVDVLTNQGDAKHYGAETELQWSPNSSLSISANIAYLDAIFLEGGILTSNINGDLVPIRGRRPFAPRWSGAIGMRYEILLGQNFSAVTNINYHYRSEFSGELNTPVEAAIKTLKGYGLLSARLDISALEQNWSISIWTRNLLDKTYLNRIKSDGLQSYIDMFGEPRSFGVSFEYQW